MPRTVGGTLRVGVPVLTVASVTVTRCLLLKENRNHQSRVSFWRDCPSTTFKQRHGLLLTHLDCVLLTGQTAAINLRLRVGKQDMNKWQCKCKWMKSIHFERSLHRSLTRKHDDPFAGLLCCEIWALASRAKKDLLCNATYLLVVIRTAFTDPQAKFRDKFQGVDTNRCNKSQQHCAVGKNT